MSQPASGKSCAPRNEAWFRESTLVFQLRGAGGAVRGAPRPWRARAALFATSWSMWTTSRHFRPTECNRPARNDRGAMDPTFISAMHRVAQLHIVRSQS